jgi:hypothetical protein
VTTLWQFASEPPQEYTPPECRPWRLGMTNEELAGWFEECRAVSSVILQQVRLWEAWARIEREAHQELKGVVK